MAGYLGTKAVLLSTTAADVVGNAEIGGDLTVGGTFTSQGIDDNASATAMTLDASGNVGIGTSSPSADLHIVDDVVTLSLESDNSNAQKWNLLSTYTNTGGSYGAFIIEDEAGSDWLRFDEGNGSPFSQFLVNGSEAMRIDASGNVIIKTLGGALRWNNGYQTITGDAGANDLTYRTYANHIFKNVTGAGSNTDGTERMRMSSSGNLLVGQQAPSSAVTHGGVYIVGDRAVSSDNYYAQVFVQHNSSYNHGIIVKELGANGPQMGFLNSSGTVVGSISSNASSTSYVTSSDYRLKTDAQPMAGASARVQALKPVNFEWISTGERVDGFLAHEAQEVVPEAVTGTKDAMRDEEYEITPAVYEDVVIPAVLDEEGNELEAERTEQRLVSEAVMGTRSVPEYQGIDQSKLVPLLTAALQEALTEIADLKERVTALEAV